MYNIIKCFGTIIRMFFLPNPFECFATYAVLINWAAEPIIHFLSYHITGLFYDNSSHPAIGSILYLMFYCIITGVLYLCGTFSFAKLPTIIIIAGFFIILGIAYKLYIRIKYGP